MFRLRETSLALPGEDMSSTPDEIGGGRLAPASEPAQPPGEARPLLDALALVTPAAVPLPAGGRSLLFLFAPCFSADRVGLVSSPKFGVG